MTIKQRYDRALAWFAETMPAPATELNYETPFQLLVAVILSAQCTDKRINMVTPALFAAFPTPADMAAATPDDIYPYIKSVSYPNNKARNLAGMAQALTELYKGEIPSDIGQLLTLPGVGRKTANVILSIIFDKAAIAVDTHVFRVSERIGLTTDSRTPLETERTLTSHIPEHLLARAHHWLILHGRYICKARRPECLDCGLTDICRYYQKSSAKSTTA